MGAELFQNPEFPNSNIKACTFWSLSGTENARPHTIWGKNNKIVFFLSFAVNQLSFHWINPSKRSNIIVASLQISTAKEMHIWEVRHYFNQWTSVLW